MTDGIERPYPSPLEPGVVARVEMARSARTWMPDVEAYLVERGLTTELAPTVCDLIDAAAAGKFWMIGVPSLTLDQAVDRVAALLKEYS